MLRAGVTGRRPGQLQISIKDVKKQVGMEAHHRFRAPLAPVSWEGQSVHFPDGVTVDVRVLNTGAGILVQGQVTAEPELECGRCLDSYRLHLAVSLEEEFREGGGRPGQRETETPGEGPLSFAGDTLDLEEAVRQNVVLGLPMKAVCRDDCRGLCPVCGRNLNERVCGCETEDVDPRLAVLKDLLNRNDRSGS